MSQLSSGGRKNRGLKQEKKDWLKIVFILMAFAIVCIIITSICIIHTLNSRKNSNLSDNSNLKDNSIRIAIGDKAWLNGLEIEKIEKTDGECLEASDNPVYEYNFQYLKISGLKNKGIENKINNEIESTVLGLKSELSENSNYEILNVYSEILGNFSDVLSVHIYYDLIPKDRGSGNYISKNIGLNYRLDNGEKIKFQDLFMSSANIKTILSQALYETFAWQFAYGEEMDYCDFDEQDYGYIENQTFKALSEYNKHQDVDFYFSSDTIFAIIRDFCFSIDMKKNPQDIAIYTRYKTTGIYKDESLKKELYAFTTSLIADAFEVENTRGENFYYEVITHKYSNKDIPEKVKDRVKEKIDEKLASYYEIAEKNPDKGYMVSCVYFCNEYTVEDTYAYQYSMYVAELDIDQFKEKREAIIAKARTQPMDEIYCYDFSIIDKDAKFFESCFAYSDDYRMDAIKENITTKAEREGGVQQFEEEQELVNNDDVGLF